MSSRSLRLILALSWLCACDPRTSVGVDGGATDGGARMDAGPLPDLDASTMDASLRDGGRETDAAQPADAGDEGRGAICDACVERRCAAQRDGCTDPECLALLMCLDACDTSWGACWFGCFEAVAPDTLNRGLAYATCHRSACGLACWTPGWPFPPPEAGCVVHRGLCDPLVPGHETCCESTDVCSDDVGYCCRALDAACEQTSDCCGSYDDVACVAGTCVVRSCYEVGRSCSDAHPCCEPRSACRTTTPSDLDICCVSSGTVWEGEPSDCCSGDIRYESGARSCL